MTARTIQVAARDGHYPVIVGPGVRANLRARLRAHGLEGRVAMVTDENVAGLWGDDLRAQLTPDAERVLPAGEATKCLAQAESLWHWLAEHRFTRSDVMVTVGGGVVGDLVGFAAAAFHRGMPFVQVPTTLLSQVDASVGGKVAIDLPAGKNLVGAFHSPKLVVADTELLTTLPTRQTWNGLAEGVKTALVGDAALFARFEQDLAMDAQRVADAVAIKARIVSADERELGLRRVLNLGHTLGHALEAATGYGPLLHGEAVVVGLRAAVACSVAAAGLSPGEAGRIQSVLARFPVPKCSTVRAAVREAMGRDKKGARWIALAAIGEPLVLALDEATASSLIDAGLEHLT